MTVAVVILLLIGAGSMWENYKITTICSSCIEKLDTIEKSITNKNFDMEESGFGEFKTYWGSNEKFLDAISSHDDTDGINASIVRLKQTLKSENYQSSMLVIHEMKLQFELVNERIETEISNIL